MGRRIAPEKKCRRCEVTKPRSEFTKHGVSPNGVHSYCKPCCSEIQKVRYAARPAQASALINRRAKLKKTYGITMDDFDSMLDAQEGSCKICRTKTPGGRGHFAIDHCHESGRVRGLLCNSCNIGLGHFKDNVDLLHRAIDYLKESK